MASLDSTRSVDLEDDLLSVPLDLFIRSGRMEVLPAMKLRKPCIHDRYDRHGFDADLSEKFPGHPAPTCPGGEPLSDDALVIERVEWLLSRDDLIAALDEWGVAFAGSEDQMVISAKTRSVLRAAARLVADAHAEREEV